MKEQARSEKFKVLIVEDHPIVSRSLAQLLNEEPDFLACGEARDARSALAAIEKQQPDLAIIDITLPGIDGFELIRMIQVKWPTLPTVVLSMHDEALYAKRALRIGARGYVMKQDAPEKLVDTLRQVLGLETAGYSQLAR